MDPAEAEGMGFFFDGYTSNSDMVGCYSHNNDSEGFGASSGTTYDTIAFSIAANNGGGGIAFAGLDYAYVYNNTCYGNGTNTTNGYRGGIVLTYHNHAAIENNICVNNGVWGIYLDSSSDGTSKIIGYNDCYGNPTNYLFAQNRGKSYGFPATNKSYAPLFANPSRVYSQPLDFALQASSPARGSGDTSVWKGQTAVIDFAQNQVTDVNGNVIGGVIDLGALTKTQSVVPSQQGVAAGGTL
jgi:parallel beta-helix repeat protein